MRHEHGEAYGNGQGGARYACRDSSSAVYKSLLGGELRRYVHEADAIVLRSRPALATAQILGQAGDYKA